jgi:hypothetical protein
VVGQSGLDRKFERKQSFCTSTLLVVEVRCKNERKKKMTRVLPSLSVQEKKNGNEM